MTRAPKHARPSRARDASWRQEEIAAAWSTALALWDVRVELSPPSALQPYRKDGDEPLAYIDLATRQVFVNLGMLDDIGAHESLAAVLAHELGHHVRHPHTLGEVARLQVLERQLLPHGGPPLLNLFFDLQVNEVVGRTHAEQLCHVYAGFPSVSGARVSAQFCFYLALYEELWARPPGTLLAPRSVKDMTKRFPGWRADARVFVDTFFALPSTHLQLVYFCSRFLRYFEDPAQGGFLFALSHDMPSPSVDDYAGALVADPLADAALDEAVRRGWIDEADRSNAQSGRSDEQVLTVIDRVTQHLPGHLIVPFRQTLVGRHYRNMAARYLFDIAADSPVAPEPSLPTVTADWEPGESLHRIDWTQSVIERGFLAPAMPLQRELIPDDSPADRLDTPSAEIYLDTSGSMPRPDSRINAMTLAAQIVALSVLRRNGRVKGIVYSSATDQSNWLYGEEAVSHFLLRYSGGGTDFPFALLQSLAAADRDVIRVVISDSDFLSNCVAREENVPILAEAASRSARLVLLLALPPEAPVSTSLAPLLGHGRVRIVTVSSIDNLAKAAAALADSFLEPLR